LSWLAGLDLLTMKIAFLTTDNREADRKYDLPKPYFGTAPTALLEGFAQCQGIEIHVVSCAQKHVNSPVKLADNIWFHSLLVPKWEWLRSAYGGCIQTVKKKLRLIEPSLVHAQGTERDCAITAAFFPGPKVLTIHGNCRAIVQIHRSRLFSYWWFQAQLERFSIPRFDGVVCISKYTHTWVSGLAKKTWLLPNAVDSKFFEICAQKEGNKPIILVVANVDARKNQNGLILSLDQLSKQHPFELRFFGKCRKDPYGQEFRRLVQARSWCVWGGMLERDRLRLEFAKATAVVLPTWEDNCPMVVLEAQAAGVPVIASNVGGVPDLVQDNRTGILTDPARPETMSKALGRLLGDPGLAKRLADEGQKQARDRFHPKVIAERHLAIYREVIASR
jgi:glycosyltransferase involved in cell wall biosynthesis